MSDFICDTVNKLFPQQMFKEHAERIAVKHFGHSWRLHADVTKAAIISAIAEGYSEGYEEGYDSRDT